MNIKQSSPPHPRHHTLNQSQLKSLTDNLRLRLRYAKLKVINGWHHQTLNEIESTVYYLLPHKHSKQQPQSNPNIINTQNPKSVTEASLHSSTSSDSSQNSDPHDSPNQPPSNPSLPILSQPLMPMVPSSLSKPTLDQSSSTPSLPSNQACSNSDRLNPETAFLIQKSTLLSSTTLTLPLKYSTPFKKVIRSGDQEDQFSTESNRFWPTRALDCPSAGSTTPIRFTSRNTSNRKNSLEALVFKMTGMDSKTSSKEANRPVGGEEGDDLFRASPMQDFQELYKPSSPASFLFNYHSRSILDSSSAKKSTRTSLLNSVSPVRIRSNLHHQSHPHPRFIKLSSNSLASPTPSRTQKSHLHRTISSSSLSKNDHDQPIPNSAQLLPEGEEDDDDDDNNKENWMSTDDNCNNLAHKPSPLKLRSSLLKFNRHPPPTSVPTNVNSSANNHDNENPMEDVVVNPPEIGLDDLDQIVWE